ncbi:hypothetical protein OTU49_014653 [Cherax quadricarinatus]|uniref:Uncharacterized protein n=1 Tax=Cherax quadricarinatus TaxID=27406 RepID=A0AAW0VPR9_CHEQU
MRPLGHCGSNNDRDPAVYVVLAKPPFHAVSLYLQCTIDCCRTYSAQEIAVACCVVVPTVHNRLVACCIVVPTVHKRPSRRLLRRRTYSVQETSPSPSPAV